MFRRGDVGGHDIAAVERGRAAYRHVFKGGAHNLQIDKYDDEIDYYMNSYASLRELQNTLEKRF